MDVYKKLALHLDGLPGGYPATESGVELRILRRLFSPEEADFACHLTLIAESPEVLAYRSGLHVNAAEELLEVMAGKGLIFKQSVRGKPPVYMAAQFVVGIWEYQVGNLSAGLVSDMEEYIPYLFKAKEWRASPQMRTVPVNRSIKAQHSVMSYERAEELVREHKRFVVTPCICRKEMNMSGKGCDKPLETCISFGSGGSYYLENGLGRSATREEVLEILEKADKAGLVLQPSNGKRVTWICCCCGCCCGILRTLRKYPNPGEIVATSFVAESDPELCNGCGLCLKRCQVDALEMAGSKVNVLKERCIGCGLCVSTCPKDAVMLQRKEAGAIPKIPGNVVGALAKLAWKRGKLGPVHVMEMVSGSVRDRFMAEVHRRRKKA